ncbi:MAG: MATE family efflux transporter [Spirochaetota bacterium]
MILVLAQVLNVGLDPLLMFGVRIGGRQIIPPLLEAGNAIAAYGASLRIEQIALMPLFGISTALSALVGQNNGAARLDRVEESSRVSVRISIVAAIAILVPVLLAAGSILRLFTGTTEVVSTGRRYLYIQGITYFSHILMNLSNAVLRGLKKPVMIMWIGLYRQIAAVRRTEPAKLVSPRPAVVID